MEVPLLDGLMDQEKGLSFQLLSPSFVRDFFVTRDSEVGENVLLKPKWDENIFPEDFTFKGPPAAPSCGGTEQYRLHK